MEGGDEPARPSSDQGIATGALEACKSRGYATGVVVVDRGGNTIVSLKDDNAGLHTVENARRKAYTALTFKMTTETFIQEMKTRPVLREQTHVAGRDRDQRRSADQGRQRRDRWRRRLRLARRGRGMR